METKPPGHGLLDRTFRVSLILKGLDGVLELIGGILLLLVTRKRKATWPGSSPSTNWLRTPTTSSPTAS